MWDVTMGTLIILLHILYPFKPSFVCSKLFFWLCTTTWDEVAGFQCVREPLNSLSEVHLIRACSYQNLQVDHSGEPVASELGLVSCCWVIAVSCQVRSKAPSASWEAPLCLLVFKFIDQRECSRGQEGQTLQLHKIFILTCFPRQKDRNTDLQWATERR